MNKKIIFIYTVKFFYGLWPAKSVPVTDYKNKVKPVKICIDILQSTVNTPNFTEVWYKHGSALAIKFKDQCF